jgi:Tautomerase enzyme
VFLRAASGTPISPYPISPVALCPLDVFLRAASGTPISPFIQGRPKETRLALLKDLNTRIATAAGVSPDDIMITLYEVPGENISFGRGEAQRAKAVAHA